MSINSQIRRLKESNYQTLPTNRARFESPFLLKSTTEAVNKWSKAEDPLEDDTTPEDLNLPFNPEGVTAMGSNVSDDDLARILQGDAYTPVDRRLNLTGYAYRKDLSDDKTSVYIGPNRILVGFRGTQDFSDIKADTYLANKAMGDFVDNMFGTKKWDDEDPTLKPRWGYTEYKERTEANDKLIKQLRTTSTSKFAVKESK